MNTISHKNIAARGFDLLPAGIKKEWKNGKQFVLKTCMYPDIFADRGLSEEEKERRDPDFDNAFLEPLPPKAAWYRELSRKVNGLPSASFSEIIPENRIYIYSYFMEKTVDSLKKGDREKAARFAGVLSHTIGDTAQPIHLVNSRTLDALIKCPDEFLGFELHAGIEGITGKPVIRNYEPELLGSTRSQALMGFYKKTLIMAEECRYTTPLMVRAVYSHNPEEAVRLAGISVKQATLVFADFLRTAWALANSEDIQARPFSLTEYPCISSTVDMLYRYRPMKNISLIPYSGGKSYPLTVLNKAGNKVTVTGLGVVPYLGPLKTSAGTVKERDARVEYLLCSGSYTSFRATVGLNPLFKESRGRVVFRVFADGRMIGKSGEFCPGKPAEELKAKIPCNAHFLTLSMLTVEEPPPSLAQTHPHGVWVNPILE